MKGPQKAQMPVLACERINDGKPGMGVKLTWEKHVSRATDVLSEVSLVETRPTRCILVSFLIYSSISQYF